MKNDINKLQEIIGYQFCNVDMLSVAISHPGLKRSQKIFSRKFEKLEFLGDRVLGLALADILYHRFEEETEGDLAVRIATLASTEFLINLAKKIKLIECFSIPNDFFISSNKNSSSIADMFEAVLGSVFLDSDFKITQKIIFNLWKNDIDKVVYKRKDAKTRLQEITQAATSELPVYRFIKMVGKAHNPVFEVEVTARGITTVGHGNSKRNAEHDAAEKILSILEGL